VYNEVLNYRANLSHKRTLCAAAVIRGWCQRSEIQSVSANINTQVDIDLSVSDRSMVTAAGYWKFSWRVVDKQAPRVCRHGAQPQINYGYMT